MRANLSVRLLPLVSVALCIAALASAQVSPPGGTEPGPKGSGPTADPRPGSAMPAAARPLDAPVAGAPGLPRRLFVEDGQLKSHPFVMFVTYPISPSMNPTLDLRGMHLLTPISSLERQPLIPKHVLPGQYRTVVTDGQSVTLSGTLLIFDLSRYPILFFKSAVRFMPAVNWTEPPAAEGKPARIESVAAEDEIYIGNMPGAVLWTAFTIAAVLTLLLRWTRIKAREVAYARPWLFLITGSDGYLSLWRTQLLLWTIAVGSVVFLFGLMRLRVPDIPETLVALMGMSVLTGTVSALKTGQSSQPRPVAAAVPSPLPVPVTDAPVTFKQGRAEWADLVSSFNKATGRIEMSVPKAQMMFWTVVILALFVVKSVLLGALWPAPWELVALTGVSQAGYVGEKLIQPPP